MKNLTLLVAATLLVGIGHFAFVLHAGHAEDAAKTGQDQQQKKQDQLLIAVQRICPMSGKKLGVMGDPVKTKIGEEELFLCCEECRNGKVNKDHLAAIHVNMAKAQGRCPVMNKAISENGPSTIVAGRTVYVCCAACKRKVQADPKVYLEKVDALYAASINVEKK